MSPEPVLPADCVCSPVYIGMKESGSYNLNPDCPVHCPRPAQGDRCDAALLGELAQASGADEFNELVWQTLICAYLDHEGWRAVAEEVFRKYGYTSEEIRLHIDG